MTLQTSENKAAKMSMRDLKVRAGRHDVLRPTPSLWSSYLQRLLSLCSEATAFPSSKMGGKDILLITRTNLRQ